LEHYTAALCACIEQVNAPASLPEISDEFVPALRAEAIFTADPARAALPLVTVAATIGELQLTYPAPGADIEAVSA
jgi:hypothetical protein